RALATRVTDEALERAIVQMRRGQASVEHATQAGFQTTDPEVTIAVVVLGERGVRHADGQAVGAPHGEVPAPQMPNDAGGFPFVDLATSFVFAGVEQEREV